MSDNAISTSTPSASPPADAPAATPPAPGEQSRHGPMPTSTPQTSMADLTVMAEGGDNVEAYAEQRAEDKGLINADASPAQRNFNRHQRKNAKLQHKEHEIAALRAKLDEQPRGADGTPDDVGLAMDEARAARDGEGEQAASAEQPETREQYLERAIEEVKRQRDYEIKVHDHKRRLDDLRRLEPNIDHYLAAGAQMPISEHLEMAILEDPNSALVQAFLVHPENQGIYHAVSQMSERDAERAIARISTLAAIRTQQYLAEQRGAPPPQQRQGPPYPKGMTAAGRPMVPLRGSASPATSPEEIASRNGSMEAYARARMRKAR